MSVGTRRLAAAQRTAVGTPASRGRRLAAWIVIVPALSLFSFSVVANAAGLGGKGSVEKEAAKVVPPAAPAKDGGVVVVDNSLSEGLSGHGKAVCWITKSGLARVSAVYRTSTSSITVAGKTYSLVTVTGADEKALRALLGKTAVECRLVQVARIFFLPFDPNMS